MADDFEIKGNISGGRAVDVAVPKYLQEFDLDEDDDLKPLDLSPLEKYDHLHAEVVIKASEKGRKSYSIKVDGSESNSSTSEVLQASMHLSDLLDKYILRTGNNFSGRDVMEY